MFDNYPPGMSYDDLVHVGEYPESEYYDEDIDDPVYCDFCGEEISKDEDGVRCKDGVYCEACFRKSLEE